MTLLFSLINIGMLIILCFCGIAVAEIKTFHKEYAYRAQKADNEMSCRVIAHEKVKVILLEELGFTLKEETLIKNMRLTPARLVSLTACIVSMDIVEEEWENKTFYIKARLTADPGLVVKAIDQLSQDRRKTEELAAVREKAEGLLQQMTRLTLLSKKADPGHKKPGQNEYLELTRRLMAIGQFEKGYSSGLSHNYRGAINAFDQALELDHHFAEAYQNRGHAYMMLGDVTQAIHNYERATSLNPGNERAHYECGQAHAKLGNYREAIRHFDRVIVLNPDNEQAYFNRGIAHVRIGSYYQALRDCDMALDLILLKECHWTRY